MGGTLVLGAAVVVTVESTKREAEEEKVNGNALEDGGHKGTLELRGVGSGDEEEGNQRGEEDGERIALLQRDVGYSHPEMRPSQASGHT